MSSLPALLLAANLARAGGDGTAAEALLEAADAARLTLQEGVMQLRVVVVGQDGKPAESALDVYVKGSDRVLCVFREGPAKGRKILVVGDRVWLLVPGTVHPIPISASHRLWGGASVADVARLRFAEDFSATIRPGEETVDQVPCHVLELKRRTPRAPYASGTLWIGRDDRLPRKTRLALGSGKQAKEIRFTAYGADDGQRVLRRMEIDHLLPSERGMVTSLEFVRYERRPLASDLFDPVRARELP